MLAFNNLRKGQQYYLINYGEKHEFEVLDIISKSSYTVRDLLTLDKYELADLISYGLGPDYELHEL